MPTAFALATRAAPASRLLGPPPRLPPASTARGDLVRNIYIQGSGQQVNCNKLHAVQWAMVCNDNGNSDGDLRTSSRTNNRRTGQSVLAAKETEGRPFKLVGQHD